MITFVPRNPAHSCRNQWSKALLRLGLASALSAAAFLTPGKEVLQEVPAGSEHSCGVTFGGSLKCWGTNFSGQLGDGTNVNRNLPVEVTGLSWGVTATAAGAEHTCAVIAGGVKCWGTNISGQIGDGTNLNRNVPVDVAGLWRGVTSIAAGAEHTCAVVNGGVVCWGTNFSGQLGDGTRINRNTPVAVVDLSLPIVAIAAGQSHTCALSAVGGVHCWGTNVSGQLGDGSNVNRNAPVAVLGLSRGATAIAAGSEHSCAVVDGTVMCWGTNYNGQLGDSTNVNRNAPVPVAGLPRPAVAVAAGGSHSCALSAAGHVQCWGTNFSGQLGDGTNVNRNAPVAVSGISSGMTAIAAGAEHTCALNAPGAMQCWGGNVAGQLGDGTNVNRNAPVSVAGLPPVHPTVRWRWLW